ncbi:MAG TPA: coproporphyrinogen III oxidase, partial [Roseiarcus sp.]|nr:coproporphyrinogen III oxidase [Roseiarcus sp.]
VDLDAVAGEYGADPGQLKDAASRGMARFVDDGLASWDGRRIVVTEQGRPFVRSIAALFDAYLGQPSDKPRHSRAV